MVHPMRIKTSPVMIDDAINISVWVISGRRMWTIYGIIGNQPRTINETNVAVAVRIASLLGFFLPAASALVER